MTDDDRMDRARRIREMRESTRPEQADDADAETADGATADAAPEGGPETGTVDDGTADASSETDDAGSDETGGTDDDAGLQVPAAEMEDVEVDVEDLARQAGLEGSEPGADDAGEVAGPVGVAEAATPDQGVATTAETRVLEFDLGGERYCLDIDHVEEIVERETVTRVPNTPGYVEGVVDLRGQITTILDPKVLLDIDAEGDKELIVVFDPEEFEDQGAIGWVVDDVNQVMPVAESEVNDPPVDEDHINGVVERDSEFVIWTDPGVAIESATG